MLFRRCDAKEISASVSKLTYYDNCNCSWCDKCKNINYSEPNFRIKSEKYEQEIKQLREENLMIRKDYQSISELLNASQTENERLKAENKRLEDYNDSLIVSWREHVAQIKQLKAQLQQAQLVHDCRKCGKDSYAFFNDGLCPNCTERKPQVCPKCEGKKEVYDGFPDVKLCETCLCYYFDNNMKYMSIMSPATKIFSDHYCHVCKQACKELKWYKDCNICNGTGLVWEPK